MTRPNYTEIIAVLDRSYSMVSNIDNVIEGFNSLVRKQKELGGIETRLTLVIFDDQIEELYSAIDVRDLGLLTKERFFARGSTALFDALGGAIVRAGERFSDMGENQRPSKVIVFTSTDGLENASSEFTVGQLRELIKQQQETYSWEFIFTGADIDSYGEGEAIGVSPVNTLNYAKTAVGTRSLYENVGTKIAQYSSGEVMTCAFTDEEREDVEKHVEENGNTSDESGVTPNVTASSTK